MSSESSRRPCAREPNFRAGDNAQTEGATRARGCRRTRGLCSRGPYIRRRRNHIQRPGKRSTAERSVSYEPTRTPICSQLIRLRSRQKCNELRRRSGVRGWTWRTFAAPLRSSASRRSINAKDARDFAKVRRASAPRSAIATHLPQLTKARARPIDYVGASSVATSRACVYAFAS